MLMVPPMGTNGSSHWIRRFLPLDTMVPPIGYDGSSQGNQWFQALEIAGTLIYLIINKV